MQQKEISRWLKAITIVLALMGGGVLSIYYAGTCNVMEGRG